MLDLIEIERLTEEYGEGWGAAHARRLFGLIEQIQAGLSYDQVALQYAVWLHDWGAFPRYFQVGVDHARRSGQIARAEILPNTPLSPEQKVCVYEAIILHDYRNPQPASSTESLLLREADCLDFLGVIGLVRAFAWGPNDLQAGYQRACDRLEAIRNRLTLPAAQEIAASRILEMEQVLARLSQESMGYL